MTDQTPTLAPADFASPEALADGLARLGEAIAADPLAKITIHIGQPGNGLEYDPAKPLPYPLFVGLDNRVENVPGYPLVRQTEDRALLPILVGFQPDLDTQRVDLDVDDWIDGTDWSAAVGMVPVLFEPGGFADGMFSLSVLVTSVS